ncbi:MAG TPA: hypothetical protein VF516_26475 [Kofleriaceae bacterium]
MAAATRTEPCEASRAPFGDVQIQRKPPRGEAGDRAADPMVDDPSAPFAAAPADLRFSFAFAAFADRLRGGQVPAHGPPGAVPEWNARFPSNPWSGFTGRARL